MPRAKHAYLFNDPDIKRWYENVTRGSKISVDVCLRRLGSFCESNKVNGQDHCNMTDDVERKLREEVKTKYGNKRGAMSIIVEETLKNYFAKENHQT
jgi:hypothetical protein